MLDLLRFTTAGSVDDGKSTLIGRLLFDSQAVFEDQLDHLAQASARRGGNGALDLALLTDGLRAEREQGITIDVAYRYFATPRRRFIIADVPGHKQYTRNMVTGASTADVSVVLVDVRHGVVEQSRRHAYISALLGIPHLVVAVNKMDLVDYDQDAFTRVADEFGELAAGLGAADVCFIPISALHGDNVVTRSEHMAWWEGPTLLEQLEGVEVIHDHPEAELARFPVQWVIRPADGAGDYRGYAGQLASGRLRAGEEILVLPSGQRTRIARIDTYDGPLDEAVAPQSVTLVLEDDLDIARGEMICTPESPPQVGRELEADVCWMSERPLDPRGRYAIKHNTLSARAAVEEIAHRVDMTSLRQQAAPGALALNDIGRVRLQTSRELAFDPYARNRSTGSFILIDEASNDTVAAGMIAAPAA
ncbi:MAG: sulfate adenylyltransferase subunit CysN [Actinobacteria bacterium]|nr:MAG: sulfate adenylyltransferase subunit CysN [Actinomycetota bacterium]